MLPVTQKIHARSEFVTLSPQERSRFSRHLLLPEIGSAGQRRLKAAKILMIGAGGLGSPISLYLAAAGIGTLGLVEFDKVDSSNLQRQILYQEADAGRTKASAAAARIAALSSYTSVELHEERLDAGNALRIIEPYDVVIDGTDNFATRYLVNDSCVILGKPNVYGSILRFNGQVSLFYPPHGPCYRCIFPEPPPPEMIPNCAEAGVLGVLPGQIGTLQATEALKLILGIGQPLIGRLVVFDALKLSFKELSIPRDEHCPVCGEQPSITRASFSAAQEPAACGIGAKVATDSVATVEPEGLSELQSRAADMQLIDVRTTGEAEICSIPGGVLIPLNELHGRMAEVQRDRPVILYCKSGQRSAAAVTMLAANGYTDVRSLSGGILAWLDAIKSQQPRY